MDASNQVRQIPGELILGAAEAIRQADALVITAGAGMGVDSGLPDFRGKEGFWKAYPPFRKLGLSLPEISNPRFFLREPQLAWGFYGHRLHLYRDTVPHAGFAILRNWMSICKYGGFVYTSNVDGQFQKAGFHHQHIVECHGSIHRLQRIDQTDGNIWSADGTSVAIDPETMRVVGEFPTDPQSGALARPNILMFGDVFWNSSVTDAQEDRYWQWLRGLKGARLAVIELGAGKSIPTIRNHSESVVESRKARLIRINLRDPEVPPGGIGMACGALEGLQAIDAMLAVLQRFAKP
jgi:NAD-dependent SIR2 family protein deacetylase